MRPAVFLTIIFFQTIFSFSQTQQRVFNKGFAKSIIHTNDGGFIMNGGLVTNTNDRSFLMKFNNFGNVQWLKYYRDMLEFESHGNCMVKSDDNGFVNAGYMYHDTLSNEEISLIKTD